MLKHLPPLSQWLTLDPAARRTVVEEVERELVLPHPFSLQLDEKQLPRALIRFPAWARPLAFRLLPAHTAALGLSPANLAAVQALSDEPQISVEEMTPLCEVDVGPLLIAELPLTVAQARDLIDAPGAHEQATFPAYLDEAQAQAALRALGASLPREAEWEAAAKAGADPLFPFGERLPAESALEPWMRYDLAAADIARNAFGIGGLFFAEWCADAFTTSHAPGAETLPGTRTIKGGGAYFWPWQDEEWVWCLSSMRMPSSDLDQGVAVCRPVIAV